MEKPMLDGPHADPETDILVGPTPKPPRWYGEPAIRWLAVEGRRVMRTRDLLRILCERLVDQGLPLARVTVHIRTLHPQVFSYGYEWRRGTDGGTEVGREHGIIGSLMYMRSPCARSSSKGWRCAARSNRPPI